MYAIIRPSPYHIPTTPDFKSEIEWALKYGTYTPPRPSPVEFLATSADFFRACKLARFLANDLGEKTEVVPVSFATGIGGVIHTAKPEQTPAITDLHKEIDAALDAFDGVPADTKEGSQIR